MSAAISKRITLNNPNGYKNYQGTIVKTFMWGREEWAEIKWDLAVHPCTSPMQTKHIIYQT